MQRAAGVLLHPTSLPSPDGIGDLGPGARGWVHWLADAGVRWWQVLPLNPPGPGQSPYSALSSFAGNPLLVSADELVREGLLVEADLDDRPRFPDGAVDFAAAIPWKDRLLRRSFDRFLADLPEKKVEALERFRQVHGGWLRDWAPFAAIKDAHGGAPWYEWPTELRRRDADGVAAWCRDHRDEVRFAEFCQFLFFRQWTAVRAHASQHGIHILGDMPIFVAYDSADVWGRRDHFLLDDEGRRLVVAGVPPDYFSATGQLWGNPLYDWQRLAADGYAWWIDRLHQTLALVDAVRIDHFRGFAAHWEVPAGDDVASGGRWVPGPGRHFFDTVREALGELPLVAEDLGEITPDVVELRRQLGLPGMAVLHFAFSPEPRSEFIPYALERDQVVYTGTHDNNTTVGWYHEDASDAERDLVRRYCASDGAEVHWDLIRLAMASVCDLAVVPFQDLAGLGSDCRMNRPSVAEGNWRFRVTDWMLADGIRDRLAELVWVYGRS